MKPKRHKTPAGYRAPLTKRLDIVNWLRARATTGNSRPSYGMFTYDVKCYDADFSFGNLTHIALKAGHLLDDSWEYLLECRERLSNRQTEWLSEWAIESAREQVDDGDTYRQLWDGTETNAQGGFDGRGGGWLCLLKFDGVTFKDHDIDDLFVVDPDNDEWADCAGSDYKWLRRLYRFLVQCDHDFRGEAVTNEIEYQASFHFFNTVCSDVLTGEQRAAIVAEQKAVDLAGLREGGFGRAR